MADITENLAQYTNVLAQITEHINARRNTAVITKSIRLPVPQVSASVPSAIHTSSSAVATAKAPTLPVLPVEDTDPEVQFDAQPVARTVRVPRVLSIVRTEVPRSEYVEACKVARAHLAAEQQRLLDENEVMLRQMRGGVRHMS